MRTRLLPVALRDIGSIHRWLSVRSMDAADRIETSIFETIEFLGEHPGLGSPTDERRVYRWPMTDYRYTIFYRIRFEENTVEILRVVDGRRVRNLRRVPRG